MKRDKRDIVFSKLIRLRARWHCERCKKYYPEGHRQGLDCSHFYGRRHRSTRWHPHNAFAHCRGCHQYLGSNPAVFAEWARNELGVNCYDAMRLRHNQVYKYTKADLEDIYQHLKRELEKMEQDALDPERELDFEPFD